MIKRLISFTLHVIILLASIGAVLMLFLRWTGYFEEETFVAYLYDSSDFALIEINQMTELFSENEVSFQSAALYGETTDRMLAMIEKGANTIILNLDHSPTDEIIALATEYDVTLFFVGALPSDTQIESYDKLWCFTESSAYAGELLGEQVALGFRDGTITDKNEDLLLDYSFLIPAETYMDTDTAIASTVLELDHYGVYSTDVYDAAYRVALADAETARALLEMEDELMEQEDTATTEDEIDETEENEDTEDTEDTSLEEQIDDSFDNITVSFSDLSSCEVMLSIGSANANYILNQASALGWDSASFPMSFACIVENYTAADTLAQTGFYHSIVYLDTQIATETVVAMAINALAQTPVTNGTEYAETQDHTFVISHLLY